MVMLFTRMYGSWNTWYAWYPVEIKDEWYWFTTVYRRVTWLSHAARTESYQYATLFDILGCKNP